MTHVFVLLLVLSFYVVETFFSVINTLIDILCFTKSGCKICLSIHTHESLRERQTKAAREWGGGFLFDVSLFPGSRDGGRGRGGERAGVGRGFEQRRTQWRQHFVTLSDKKHTHTHTYTLSQSISSLLKDVYCWEHCLIAALKQFVLYQYFSLLFQCCIRCF